MVAVAVGVGGGTAGRGGVAEQGADGGRGLLPLGFVQGPLAVLGHQPDLGLRKFKLDLTRWVRK